MPSGCTVFIEEHKPEHCRVNFDACLIDICDCLNALRRLPSGEHETDDDCTFGDIIAEIIAGEG